MLDPGQMCLGVFFAAFNFSEGGGGWMWLCKWYKHWWDTYWRMACVKNLLNFFPLVPNTCSINEHCLINKHTIDDDEIYIYVYTWRCVDVNSNEIVYEGKIWFNCMKVWNRCAKYGISDSIYCPIKQTKVVIGKVSPSLVRFILHALSSCLFR